jgi:hypothetical protein
MKRAALPLAGSAILVAVAVLRLPPPRLLLRQVATPFDRSKDPGAGAHLILLTQVSALIPKGASVAVRAASGDPTQSVYSTLQAMSLLPGREILPPESDIREARPDFLLLAGQADDDVPGRLLLRTPQGALWKLER